MTDKKTIQFWNDKLAKIDTYDGDNGEMMMRQGQIAFQILCLQEMYNDLSEKIAYQRRSQWYRTRLAERIMKKFRIKSDIYRSKKATAYWKKYFQKPLKVKAEDKIDDFNINKILGFFSAFIYERKLDPVYVELLTKLLQEVKNDCSTKYYNNSNSYQMLGQIYDK